MVVSLTLGLYSYNKKATEEEEKISISRWMLVFFMLFICLNTGSGGFTGQTGDWSKYNAVLHDLIEYRWPVVYTTSYGDSMLSYYIGQYLLPAVIGKIFYSFHAAELIIYNILAILYCAEQSECAKDIPQPLAAKVCLFSIWTLSHMANHGTLEQFADFTNPEIADDLKYNYYSYDLERDIFY